jgi:hypothetical protein
MVGDKQKRRKYLEFLCNGLAMIAKFFHTFPVIGAKTKKAHSFA